MKLWLDTETRSRVDLKKHGSYRYAEDPSTQALILSYALDDSPVKTWFCCRGQAMPADLKRALANPRVIIYAQNAAFDRLVMRHAMKIDIPIRRWYCTLAQMRALALPGALEDAGRALNLKQRKDRRGAELIQLLSIPRADGTFCEDADLIEEFGRYCAQDVAVMRAMSSAVAPLTQEALATYHANEVINDRGLPIDSELCAAALKYAEREADEANAHVQSLSGGELRTAKGTSLTRWVYARLPETLQKFMHVYKNGERRLSLAADIRGALLDLLEENPDAMPTEVADMIEAAEAAAMTSVSKFGAMLDRVSADGRVRGAYVFNGASQTGRFSSKGAQLHNYPRTVAKDPEALRALILKGADLPGGTLAALKSMLRPAIVPHTRRGLIVRCDWNAIEARALPWLATRADHYLDAFRDASRDIYVEQSHASGLGGARQPGKVVVLSLGYGGAEGALNRMAKAYGVLIDNPGLVVKRWRRANTWAVRWWRDLMMAAMEALRHPGVEYSAGRITYTSSGGWLIATLPGGRNIYYPMAKYDGEDVDYLKAAWKPKAGEEEWPRARLWHGTAAENGTQAVCASLLREAIVRGLDAKLDLIGHVHDEMITEADNAKMAKEVAAALKACMLTAPGWAEGFPLAAEVDISRRYRK